MKKLMLFLLCLMSLAACRKTPQNSIGAIKMTDYPVKVNNSWTYQVIDSIHHITDTAVFTITGKTVVNSDSNIYTYQTIVNNAVVDSGTITQNATSYFYSPNTSNYIFSTLKLNFPINNHSGWQGSVPEDTLYVLSTFQNFSVLGKNYPNVYLINRRQMMVDNSVQATIYIATGIGVIQEDLLASPWIPQNKTVRLINYSLN